MAGERQKTYYVCKYTPVELLTALGGEAANLNDMRDGFEVADSVIGANVCGFGKTVVEAVFDGGVRELVLVNCCDTIRSVYDVLAAWGKMDFLYMVDVLHADGPCARDWMVDQLKKLAQAYGAYKGTQLTADSLRAAFCKPEREGGPYVSVMGARMGSQLFAMVQDAFPIRVQNDTCVNNRSVGEELPPEDADLDGLLAWYAGQLTGQVPCMRMLDASGRKRLYNDPNLKGIIYHTVRFCDFYSFEYAELKNHAGLPLVKIESDYTTQSAGQLSTRLEAFAESLHLAASDGNASASDASKGKEKPMGKGYFAGIDSGSTSTDVVVIDQDGAIAATAILPTGAGASLSAEQALDEALRDAGFARSDIDAVVTTGYGRAAIQLGDESVTEITCHARGAHYLDSSVRTVIDIGGQDSKVIKLDADGHVVNFTMNDKCAAGTGRFLDTMARTMEMSLDELSGRGLAYKEDITISNTCTVFAESEVVSLIAQNKDVDDIVHGLDKAVAVKTGGLARRVDGEAPYMMTGGVSKNAGVVKALEERLGCPVIISPYAQLCGALGAALYARDL